jgi:hypothetical protein
MLTAIIPPIIIVSFIELIMVCILSNHTTLNTFLQPVFSGSLIYTRFYGVAYTQFSGECVGILVVSFSGSMLRLFIYSIKSSLCVLFYQSFNKSCLMPYSGYISTHCNIFHSRILNNHD